MVIYITRRHICKIHLITTIRSSMLRLPPSTSELKPVLCQISVSQNQPLLPVAHNPVMKSFLMEEKWPVYPTESITWLLGSWWHKTQGQQQPWYWPSSPGVSGLTRRVKVISAFTEHYFYFWYDIFILYHMPLSATLIQELGRNTEIQYGQVITYTELKCT